MTWGMGNDKNHSDMGLGKLSNLTGDGVAKFDPKVGSQRTTKIKNLVVLVIILVVLILLLYYMYVVLVLIDVFVGKRKIT